MAKFRQVPSRLVLQGWPPILGYQVRVSVHPINITGGLFFKTSIYLFFPQLVHHVEFHDFEDPVLSRYSLYQICYRTTAEMNLFEIWLTYRIRLPVIY